MADPKIKSSPQMAAWIAALRAKPESAPSSVSQFADWASTPQPDAPMSLADLGKWATTPQPGAEEDGPARAVNFAAGMMGNLPGMPNVGNGAVPAQIAFHGSPHDFDRFSMERVGEGEGAQAYGHGLYFAEEPQVAEQYRSKLAGQRIGFPTAGDNTDHGVRSLLETASASGANTPAEIHATALDHAQSLAESGRQFSNPERVAYYESVVDRLKKIKPEELKYGGRAYAVDVPDNENLLHRDLPLSGQPQAVRSALAALPIDTSDLPSNALGGDIYTRLMRSNGAFPKSQAGAAQQAASRLLADAGIPGLRYFDQGSRGAGDGTHNFVIWDDSKIKPIAKAPTMADLLNDARVQALMNGKP